MKLQNLTPIHDVIYKFHHKKHDNGQVDITDLKEIQDDEDNDLDVLLYKATIDGFSSKIFLLKLSINIVLLISTKIPFEKQRELY